MTRPLFSPLKIKSLNLPNRIVMAPMTRSFSPGGVPGENVAEYYARRAEGGVGLIITEGTTVKRGGASNDVNVPNFHRPDSLAGWKRVADRVHASNGLIAPQLWHQGMLRKPGSGPEPDAPSDSPAGVTHTGKKVAEEPTSAEVDDMVMAYANAAGEAARLGFDAIEIHGAHGYLIDEFFWDVMNKRNDRFGGSLPERATFAADIIRETRKQVGPDMPIILRYSQWKQQDYDARLAQNPTDLEAFLKVFVDAGVDVLHVSQRRYWEPEFPDVDGENGLNGAGWAKKLTGLPTITVGSVGLSSDFIGAFRGEDSSVRTLDDLEDRLSRGEFDMVAVGRALLQDPDWVAKIRDGRTDELASYDAKSLTTLY
ncbi:NADH:flavin oxidoreductase [Hyphomonas johnsonii]|uniref:FAD/FMN-binding oxidoreductase n=1 Tax=Hyphomonas johnsonii MHS-2 TaxID=1280950 RepID=A0A059FQB6_9PROT|nr:NADH:flavin oxidoreductase [Hyphomonas johnsonii]KCZ92849.1 FAD/FMN-binding oxidoreductase [Hyphomonas johnsonii MHS-2]